MTAADLAKRLDKWPIGTGGEPGQRALLDEVAERLRAAEGLASVMSGLAECDCAYGDGCPTFGSRHGRCVGCIARDALAAYRTADGAGG